MIARSVVWHTTTFASRSTAPGAASTRSCAGVSAVPSRFMNAAIASRLTGSVGQYSVADVQPVVTARFFSHSTFGQNVLVSSTSVKPAHGSASANGAASSATADSAVVIASLEMRFMVSPRRCRGHGSES